jgi:hypothetical protein
MKTLWKWKEMDEVKKEKRKGNYKVTITPTIYRELLKPRNITPLEDYKETRIKLKHKCDVCGYEWYGTPDNIIYAKSGCPPCGIERARKKRVKTKEQYIKELAEVTKDIILVDEYINCITPVYHLHIPTDHLWKKSPNDLLQGSGSPTMQQGHLGIPNTFDGIFFSSHFERDCYKELIKYVNKEEITLQKPYVDTNYKCDFYFEKYDLWVEVSTISTQYYLDRIWTKRNLVTNFIFANNVRTLREMFLEFKGKIYENH